MCSSIADINECALGSDGCQHKCNNIDGSFFCSCNAGYTLNPDGQHCTGECYIGDMYIINNHKLLLQSIIFV